MNKLLAPTLGIVHAGFRGFQIFVARKKSCCKLISFRLVTYEKSMNDIKEYKGLGGNKVVSDKVNNINENTVAEAMAIGCSKVDQFYKKENKNIIQDAFDIHEAMRIPAVDTLPKYQNCETQYATVFDITNLKLYFRTKSNPNIREISFKDFENNCSTKAKLLEIQTSAEGIVNIRLLIIR